MKYVLLSLLFYFPAATDFIVNYGIEFYPSGYITVLISFLIISYAIVRYRLMDIRVFAARTLIFFCISLPLITVPFIIGFFSQSWILTGISASIIAPAGLRTFQYFTSKAEGKIRARKLKQLHALSEFLEEVKNIREIEELADLLLEKTAKLVGVAQSSLYLRDENNYRLFASRKVSESEAPAQKMITENNPLIKTLKHKGEPLVKKEIDFYVSQNNVNSLLKDTKEAMGEIKAQVAIPCLYQGELPAVLILGHRLSFQIYQDDDLEVFRMLGINIGMAIKNALYLNDLNKLHSDLLASERLAAIGRLATSAKHEISNPLNIVYGSFQQAMMDIKDRQKGHKRAVEYLISARDKTEKMLAELNSVKDVTDIDLIAIYDRALNILQRTEDELTLEQFKGELKDALNAITQFIERMHSLTVANEKEQKLKTELIHTAEVAHKHITKVIDFDDLLYKTIEKGFRGAGRISQAVNAIYHLPKELEQEAAAVNVKELIKESMSFTGYQSYWENLSKTGFEMQIPETLPDVKGYLNRLVSVFSNIFLNAYQAMTSAELTNTEERLIRIVARISEEDPDMVEIRVANKGPLIAKENLDKIFRQGYSTKEGNKGLGLDIAKTQVEVFHNGTISVSNIDDFGPEFVVRLPVWSGGAKEEL